MMEEPVDPSTCGGKNKANMEVNNVQNNGNCLGPGASPLVRIPESLTWSSSTGGSNSSVAGSVISYGTISADSNGLPIATCVLCTQNPSKTFTVYGLLL